MAGFEPRPSGVGSDRSENCVTTTAFVGGRIGQFLTLPL